MIDLATRAYNHNWRMDPIVRSLLDLDFYKLMMGQLIFEQYRDVRVKFQLTNRSKWFNLANHISCEDLIEQLDYVRDLSFSNKELIWLAGNTFYGQERIFKPEFINFLRNFKLPEYQLDYVENPNTNELELQLSFEGTWAEVTLWEIYALSILSELKTRSALLNLDKFELDITYANAKSKLWHKLQKIKKAGVQNLSDMGTRRRHSFLWQAWAVDAAADVLGDAFAGTSNAYLAMEKGYEAIGTNAHELPMTLTALAASNGKVDDILNAQYEVLESWQKQYSGNLLVALPDTYGTTQFLKNAPEFLKDWRGFRPDSKEPHAATEELIAWWQANGVNPKEKLVLFSDGLDADNIVELWDSYHDRVTVGFGWGTNLTNDFKGCHPLGERTLDPLSLVCKVSEANGFPAVKLSDNFAKATGPENEVARYKEIFGSEGTVMGKVPTV